MPAELAASGTGLIHRVGSVGNRKHCLDVAQHVESAQWENERARRPGTADSSPRLEEADA
jgi:hypothetical protein